MKLEINLDSREEIAAAVPLLQTILNVTGVPVTGTVTLSQTHAIGDMSITNTATGPGLDPAQVFGGAPAPAPFVPPAPSTAAVAPLPTAPVDTTGNTSAPTTPAFVPPAPNSASAPVPAAPPAAPPAPGVELDKNGLPWDERIHAGTKTKIKDGSWKAKKGVDDATVAAVTAELRARLSAAPASPTQPWPFPDPAAAPAAAPGVPAAAAPFVPPAAPSVPAAPAAPSVLADPTSFEELMPRITAAVSAGVMPPTAVGGACVAHGVASVVTLQQNPAYIPLVWATLKQSYPTLQ